MCKVHIFWEGHKILRNLHLTFEWHYTCRTKLRWRFRKILWPSQNIWTLIHWWTTNDAKWGTLDKKKLSPPQVSTKSGLLQTTNAASTLFTYLCPKMATKYQVFSLQRTKNILSHDDTYETYFSNDIFN